MLQFIYFFRKCNELAQNLGFPVQGLKNAALNQFQLHKFRTETEYRLKHWFKPFTRLWHGAKLLLNIAN